MNIAMLFRSSIALATAVALVSCTASARAANAGKQVDPTTAVEWFTAMNEGKVDVQFIPRDATKANIVVKNLTDEEILLRLPEAFAAVNIQPQMGMGGMGMGGGMGGMGGMGGGGMGGMGGGMGMGGGQAMGGGMGGMGGGMGGMGGGMGGMGGGMGGMGGMGMGGMMRIAPEKTRKVQVTTVCLEHDKPDPQPKMAYKMVPLEAVTADPRVGEVCKMLGNGRVTQNTAQAAAWHLTDQLDWQSLAMKNRVESQYTGNIPFFNPVELRQAMAVVAEAVRLSEAAGDTPYVEDRYAKDRSADEYTRYNRGYSKN